jgi:hypothetical protein
LKRKQNNDWSYKCKRPSRQPKRSTPRDSRS